MDIAAKLSGTMKVRKSLIVSKLKKEYTVSSSTPGKINYEVVISRYILQAEFVQIFRRAPTKYYVNNYFYRSSRFISAPYSG